MGKVAEAANASRQGDRSMLSSLSKPHGLRVAAALAMALSIAACSKDSALDAGAAGYGAGGPGGPATPGSIRDFAANVGDRVFFESDSTDLTPTSVATLDRQAQWLSRYPRYSFLIEGHADERGTREYNLALGERRRPSRPDRRGQHRGGGGAGRHARVGDRRDGLAARGRPRTGKGDARPRCRMARAPICRELDRPGAGRQAFSAGHAARRPGGVRRSERAGRQHRRQPARRVVRLSCREGGAQPDGADARDRGTAAQRSHHNSISLASPP